MDINNTPIKDTEEYKQLTKSLEILEQQRKIRENDIEKLKKLKKDALDNPIDFLERLISGSITLPLKQPIEPVPVIPNLGSGLGANTVLTKRKLLTDDFYAQTDNIDNSNNNNIKDYSPSPTITTTTTTSSSSTPSTPSKKRRADDPATFNRPWSEEEQKHLEELLVEFPEEPVASHRWTKIANALKNRTPKQVASRTQKYFVKLHKLGLPIPGKPPNLPSLFPKPPMKKKKGETTYNSNVAQVNNYIPPGVPISPPSSPLSTSTSSTKKNKSKNKSKSSSSNVKSSKLGETALAVHEGYKCDGCDAEPIVGVRWRCEECLEIDLCDECNSTYEEIGSHKSSHHMKSYSTVDPDYFRDEDYRFSYTGGESNYLDPNYTG